MVTRSEATPAEVRKKRGLIALAVGLTALLVFLLAVLLLFVGGADSPDYEPVAGIQPLRLMYGPGVGKQPFFRDPMGSAFGKNGRVYVADSGNHRVVVFDVNGRYLFQFGGLGIGKPAAGVAPTWKPGLFNYPTDVAVDDDGNVYVADFRNDQVQVFDANGTFLRVFPDRLKQVGKGSSGQGGRGIAVTSICVKGDRVFATDRYQILEFDTEGTLMAQFGKPGDGAGDLDHPNGITLDLNSNLIVADSNHNRVLAFSSSGELLWAAGQPAGQDWSQAPTALEVPRGLTSLPEGGILVADAMGSQLVMVSGEGTALEVLGVRGDLPGQFNFPTDVDWHDGLVVVSEKGNNRVQIVRLVDR